jgi:Ca2+-transporting ATPase
VHDNTRKALHFLLSTNLSEILVVVGALCVGQGSPLNPRQLLWLNLVSDVFPGLALALDPAEEGVMERPPPNSRDPLLSRGELHRIGLEGTALATTSLASWGYGIWRHGIGARASSVAFMSLACGQLLHALACRSRYRSLGVDPLRQNPHLGVTVAGTLAFQIAAALHPALRGLLGLAPLGLLDAAVVAASALVPLAFAELGKPRRIRPLGSEAFEASGGRQAPF